MSRHEENAGYASLCSGIGGLDLAVEEVFGHTLAWHAEWADEPASIHERYWPGVPNLKDLTAIDWAAQTPVQLICAGYPCQPFSHAGARKGEDDERHLWPYIAEAVRVLRPRWVVLENVAGHLSLGFGTVLGDLAAAGYDAEWCCIRASDVGAPHGRLRLFVVAADSDLRGRQIGGEPDGQPSARVEPSRRADAHGRYEAPVASSDTIGESRPRNRHSEPRDGSQTACGAAQTEPGRCNRFAADPDLEGLERTEPAERQVMPAWGDYEPAIRRWETLTRPAPNPTDGRGRLAPEFVEWMMGYPEGWTAGLKRNARLKALGNAVVPQQGTMALSLLLAAHTATAAVA